jgi:hypothetical protein
VSENRQTALRLAIELWSGNPVPLHDILHTATELEAWLERPPNHLILTASTPRPIPHT